jgi:hypothetical protein
MPVTGPLNLEKASWLAVGVGLHLTVPGVGQDGRRSQFNSHDALSRHRADRDGDGISPTY